MDAMNIPIYMQQTAQESSGDKEKADKLLAEAAAMYSESGRISDEVSISADDNLNGMPYTGSGNAFMESNGEIIHITSDVTYQTDGREMT